MSHYIIIGIIYLLIAATSIISYDGKKIDPLKEKRAKQKESVKSFKYYYRFTQLISLGVFVLFFAGYHELVLSWFHNLFYLYIGASISILGCVVFTAAKLNLGQQYSHCSDMYLPKDIVTYGVYRFIRHPIYTANLLIVYGLFIATGSIFVLVTWIGMVIYYTKSAKIEEQCLESHFSEYRRYKANTGRFLPWAGKQT